MKLAKMASAPLNHPKIAHLSPIAMPTKSASMACVCALVPKIPTAQRASNASKPSACIRVPLAAQIEIANTENTAFKDTAISKLIFASKTVTVALYNYAKMASVKPNHHNPAKPMVNAHRDFSASINSVSPSPQPAPKTKIAHRERSARKANSALSPLQNAFKTAIAHNTEITNASKIAANSCSKIVALTRIVAAASNATKMSVIHSEVIVVYH
jgi:hypothetical protein